MPPKHKERKKVARTVPVKGERGLTAGLQLDGGEIGQREAEEASESYMLLGGLHNASE